MKKTLRINWQISLGIMLFSYGISSIYLAVYLQEVSEMASNITLGQASVFVLWGIREIFGGFNKNEKNNKNKLSKLL